MSENPPFVSETREERVSSSESTGVTPTPGERGSAAQPVMPGRR